MSSAAVSTRIRVVALACLVAITVIADVACTKKPEISFSLRVPQDVLERVAWYEIAAYPDVSCPGTAQFAGGVPTYGAAARVAFKKETASPPGLGDLKRGSYAFAAAAKDESCGVIAVGCTTADVGETREVIITMKPVDPPTGVCANGTVCADAQCVPSNDNGDPSVGANCSLQLLGAGPLGNPLGQSATAMSFPVIVPTSSGGFLIAYREFDTLVGQARLVFIPVDSGGGATSLPLISETLKDRCSTAEESDGVGMAFSGDRGLVALARQPCNGTAGFDFYAIDESGNTVKYGAELNASLAASRLSLSAVHTLAPAATPGNFWLVTVKDSQAILNQTTDVHFATSAPVVFPSGTPAQQSSNAWVVATDKLLALLAGGTGVIGSGPQDAGPTVDAGRDAGDSGGGTFDAGGPEPVLRLNVVAPNANLTALPPAYEFPGSWASMAAQGTRLAVASSGTTPGKPVAFRLFDVGARDPKVTDGFNTEGLGKVAFADVAFNAQGRLFFAVELPGDPAHPSDISLVVYDGAASNNPTFLREVSLGQNPRVPAIKDVRDGRIAIAANDTRVGVVWVTGKQLTSNDPTGGYAVFACR